MPHSIQEDAGRDKQHREGHVREGDDEEVAAGGEREAVNAITATLGTTVTGRPSWSRPASIPPTPRDDTMPAVKSQNTAGYARADPGDDVVAMLDQMPQLIHRTNEQRTRLQRRRSVRRPGKRLHPAPGSTRTSSWRTTP